MWGDVVVWISETMLKITLQIQRCLRSSCSLTVADRRVIVIVNRFSRARRIPDAVHMVFSAVVTDRAAGAAVSCFLQKKRNKKILVL